MIRVDDDGGCGGYVTYLHGFIQQIKHMQLAQVSYQFLFFQ